MHIGLRSTNTAANAAPASATPEIDAVLVLDAKRKVKTFRSTGLVALDTASEHLLRQMGWRTA